MAGILLHAREFRKRDPYIARDGSQHYEIALIGGGQFTITRQTWQHLVTAAVELGIPADEWPAFDSEIDLPVGEIQKRNESLAHRISPLSDDEIGNPTLQHIVQWIRSGELICYDRT